MPGSPFEAIGSPDGCWVYVSVSNPTPRADRFQAGIAVYHRGLQGSLNRAALLPLSDAFPSGMALTHDGKLLVAADDHHVYFIDTDRLVHPHAAPILGEIRDAVAPGSVYVIITKDDRTLFVSDEEVSTVTVINLSKARRTGFHQDSIVGDISTGRAPVGLALSKDGRYLFITSEIWPGLHDWPDNCHPEVGPPGPRIPQGAVEIIDVAKATHHPRDAIVGRVPAGCSPVRAVLSSDGRVLYVTAREDNALLAFDEPDLLKDPQHALIGTVPVGTAPVGVAVTEDGKTLVVADSSRFGGSGGSGLTVIDASKVPQGSSAVRGTVSVRGFFPRELHTTADGGTLLLTVFGSAQIELIPVARLATAAADLPAPPQ